MNRVLKICIKYWYIILPLIIFFVIILPPIFTNFFFNQNTSISILQAKWTAGEQLLYITTIIGTLVTLSGLIITLTINQYNLEKQHRESVLPYFVLDPLDRKYKEIFDNDFIYENNNCRTLNEYREFKNRKIYIQYKNQKFEYSIELNENLKSLIEHNNYVWKKIGATRSLVKGNVLSIPFEIVNYGQGNAVNVRIGLNFETTSIEKRKYALVNSYKTNEEFYLNLIFTDLDKKSPLNYLLEIIYFDIYGNQYKQQFNLNYAIENEESFISYVYKTNQTLMTSVKRFEENEIIIKESI